MQSCGAVSILASIKDVREMHVAAHQQIQPDVERWKGVKKYILQSESQSSRLSSPRGDGGPRGPERLEAGGGGSEGHGKVAGEGDGALGVGEVCGHAEEGRPFGQRL